MSIALVAAVACGGSDKKADPDAAIGLDAARVDAAPGAGGALWSLSSATVTAVELYDPAPLNTERTVRILVTMDLGNCALRAIPAIEWQVATQEVFVDMRIWRPAGLNCPTQVETITRPISLRFPEAGRWRLQIGTPDNVQDGIEVEILAAPDRACGAQAGDCEMDCDCPQGQACLGSSGIVGTFTQCVVPCELNRDCGGTGSCAAAGNAIPYSCNQEPECGDCPAGYTCQAGACEAAFTLDATSRGACTGDNDCAEPLHCVQATAGGSRCEVLCPTETPYWCASGHTCGQAANDAAGTAASDSVCIGQ